MVVQTAYDHSLAPLFCSRLLENFSDHIPPELRQAMRVHLDRHRAMARNLGTALLQIIGELENRGIEAIAFKGPTLSQRAFADPNLRLFYDLDILLQDTDVERGVACLLDMGYRHADDLSARRKAAVRGYGGQYHMRHPQTGVCVEPHWALTPSTMAIDLDYEQWWLQASTQTFQQRPVLAFAPEHEVLMLCIHAAKEGWRSLKPVADLAGFLDRHPRLDWDRLVDQACLCGCLRMLLLGLQLVHTLAGLKIEPSCQSLIARDKRVQTLSRDLVHTLQDGKRPPADPYRIDRYYFALRERWSDKLRFILRTTFTPRANHYDLIRLPDALQWLYSPIKVGWDYLIVPIWKRVRRP
jgi:hypothetical protein